MFRKSLIRHDVMLSRTGQFLAVHTLDYRAGPSHLSHRDLATLGLKLELPVGALPTSAVLHCAGDGRFCERHSPDALATAERGRFPIGDLLFLAVKEGIDLFVWDNHASPLAFPISAWPALTTIAPLNVTANEGFSSSPTFA